MALPVLTVSQDLMHVMESQHTNKSVKAVLKRKLNPQLCRCSPLCVRAGRRLTGEQLDSCPASSRTYNGPAGNTCPLVRVNHGRGMESSIG